MKCVEGEQSKLKVDHDHDWEETEHLQEPFLFVNKQCLGVNDLGLAATWLPNVAASS